MWNHKMHNHKKRQKNVESHSSLTRDRERDTGIPLFKSERVLALQVPAQSITKSLSVYVYSRERGRDAERILLAP